MLKKNICYLFSGKKPEKQANTPCKTSYWGDLAVIIVCFLLAGLSLCCFCMPVFADTLLISDLSISGRIEYSGAYPNPLPDMTQKNYNISLEKTVFGSNFSPDVVRAINNRAYTNAVAAELEAQKAFAEQELAKAFYLPDVNLEYPEEGLEMSCEMQKFVYEQCIATGLDYWTVMGLIAHESRFKPDIIGYYNGITYYGYMQVDRTCAALVRDWLNDDTLDPTDPYDNIVIGTNILRYMIDNTGSEYSGVFAYGIGLGAWQEKTAQGIYSDRATERIFNYRELLLNKERSSGVDL